MDWAKQKQGHTSFCLFSYESDSTQKNLLLSNTGLSTGLCTIHCSQDGVFQKTGGIRPLK